MQKANIRITSDHNLICNLKTHTPLELYTLKRETARLRIDLVPMLGFNMREKSKELLDNLNKIVKKPKSKWERSQVLSDCNKMWKSTINSGIYSLPKSYDEDKWINASDDDDNDVYKWCDRVYGGLYSQDLLQKDGTTYKGKLYHKKRLIKNEIDGKNFYSQ